MHSRNITRCRESDASTLVLKLMEAIEVAIDLEPGMKAAGQLADEIIWRATKGAWASLSLSALDLPCNHATLIKIVIQSAPCYK